VAEEEDKGSFSQNPLGLDDFLERIKTEQNQFYFGIFQPFEDPK
jgi:hypothetical protein